MSYSIDLRKKVIELVEGGKKKREVSKLLGIGVATIYRWVKRKGEGRSLEPSKNGRFIRKIDPEMLKEYVEKYPDHTLAEMKQNLGFGTNSIWYRLKQLKITLKKSHAVSGTQRGG